MLDKIVCMYITLISPIIAGILNMAWCKSGILPKLNKPIDFEKKLKDGKRIFGENKTWKGFLRIYYSKHIYSNNMGIDM